MKKRHVLAAAIAVLLAGCESMQYEGHRFDPLPPEKPVRIGYHQGDIDPAQYMIIGRGVLSLSIEADIYDLDEALTDAARAYGADAIGIVKDEIVTRGLREPAPEYKLKDPDETETPCPLNDMEKTAATFGDPIQLRGEKRGFVSRKIYVVLWKDRKTAEPLIRKQQELLTGKAAGIWNGENDNDMETPETDAVPEETETAAPALPAVEPPEPSAETTDADAPVKTENAETASTEKASGDAKRSEPGVRAPEKQAEPVNSAGPVKPAGPTEQVKTEKQAGAEEKAESGLNLPAKP